MSWIEISTDETGMLRWSKHHDERRNQAPCTSLRHSVGNILLQFINPIVKATP